MPVPEDFTTFAHVKHLSIWTPHLQNMAMLNTHYYKGFFIPFLCTLRCHVVVKFAKLQYGHEKYIDGVNVNLVTK